MHALRSVRLWSVGVTLALVAAACGGSSGGGAAPSAAKPKVSPADCGLAEFAKAKKPVDVVFWHSLARSTNDWFVAEIARFNASQHEIRVILRQQPSQEETFVKYRAGLSSGDLPDLVEFQETPTQQLIDARNTVPVQACIDASHYPLTDYVSRALQYYAYQGTQMAMPWNVSNPILFYNPEVFRKAGLDPDKPPQTLAEVKAYSQKIVASGASKHGVALQIKPYLFEFLLAKSGGELVNNGNGRKARATAANLDSPTSRKVFAWWGDMVKSGLALNTGPNPDGIDHLLAIGTNNAGMVMEGSGVIGNAEAVLKSGEFKGVTIRSAPLPALTTGGGVPVGDGSLWIPNHSSLVKRAAAWKLIQFLDSPQEQAALSVEAGYLPIRTSATKLPSVVSKWAADPNYRTGYDQLLAGPITDANVGSLIGDYQGVRNAIRDGINRMITDKLSADAAAASAQAQANQAINDYNTRIGG